MKKTILATVLAIGFAGSAFATGLAYDTAGVTGSAKSVSGSATFATSSGNGGSVSKASNTTWSVVSGNAGSDSSSGFTYGGNWCRPTVTGTVAQGSVGVSGDVATGSVSSASNKSWGNGTGGAAAGGLSTASVAGAGGYAAPGVSGAAGGFATSTTANAVVAGRNEFGFVAAGNVAGFEAGANSKQTNSLVNFKQTNVAQTNAEAYSISNEFGFGNADIFNTNSGTAGAAAVSAAGKTKSATPQY